MSPGRRLIKLHKLWGARERERRRERGRLREKEREKETRARQSCQVLIEFEWAPNQIFRLQAINSYYALNIIKRPW